jgi:hypothetical protein
VDDATDRRAVLRGTLERRRLLLLLVIELSLVRHALGVLDSKMRHGALCDGLVSLLGRGVVKGGQSFNAGQLAAVSRCLGDPD